MDIKMIKNSILTMFFLLSTLQAEGLFSKLPYNIQLGKKVPKKIEKMMKLKKYYTTWYTVYNKFEFEVENHIITEIHFLRPPKLWRKAGIKLCNKYTKGTSYEQMKKLIKDNHGSDIEEEFTKWGAPILKFKVDNDKQFYLSFTKEFKPNENCKGGLEQFTVYLQRDDDY